jgi:RNA polymerase sigma factor (sigma-70 family)
VSEQDQDRELAELLGWAIRAATVRARQRALPEHALIDGAVAAVSAAVRTHDGTLGELGAHVRARVRWELLDAARAEQERWAREPLLEDMEGLGREAMEDDTLLLQRSGLESQVVGSAEDSLLQHERRTLRDRAVDGLEPGDRRLYTLRHREGRGWDEIAAALGMSRRTAQYHDARIRAHLTKVLRARLEEEAE